MKSPFFRITLVAGAFLIPGTTFALSLDDWVDELSGLNSDDALELIVENRRSWPKLEALSKMDENAGDDARRLAELVLEALKSEASSIASDSSKKSITARTRRAISIARTAKTAGGYLNDLISVSGEYVAIVGAWVALDQWPETAEEIKEAVYRDSEKEPLWAKEWFTKRIDLDTWLSDRKERLEKVKDDTPGFQVGNYLGYERTYPNNKKPTVFDLIEYPDLNVLWWQVFMNDYELVAAVPAGCDFLSKGGVLSPVPKNKPSAVADVFGEHTLPYSHQLRSGRIHAEAIWRSRDLAIEEDTRKLNLRIWFGD